MSCGSCSQLPLTLQGKSCRVESLGERSYKSKQAFSILDVEAGPQRCPAQQAFSASGIEAAADQPQTHQTFSASGVEAGPQRFPAQQAFSASGVEAAADQPWTHQAFSASGVEASLQPCLSQHLQGKSDGRERAGRPAQQGCPKSSTGRPAQKGCPKTSELQYSDGTVVSARASINQYIAAHTDELERVNVKGSQRDMLCFGEN